MKYYLSLPLLLMCLLVSCGKNNTTDYEELLSPLYTPEYASGFEVYSLDGCASTVIRSKNPWMGASGEYRDAFVRRGDEQPPKGFVGTVVPADPQRIVVLSSSYIGMLDRLGAVQRIVGVSGLPYVTNAYLRDPLNGVRDLGFDLNYELLLSLTPDVVLLYGQENANTTVTNKLDELKVPYIYFGEYLEEHPLGKSEWIVAAGELLDRRDRAIRYQQEVSSRYSRVREVAAQAEVLPTVMLNLPYNDVWQLPPKASFQTTLLTDAGSVPFYGSEERGEMQQIGMETAIEYLQKADYWLHLGMVTEYRDLPPALMARSSTIRPIQEDHLYNNNRITNDAGGNAYFETGPVEPDVILADLVSIFHPELMEHEPVYYRHISVH